MVGRGGSPGGSATPDDGDGAGSEDSGSSSAEPGKTLADRLFDCSEDGFIGNLASVACAMALLVGPDDEADDTAPTITAATLAEMAFEQATITVPRPHTSPDGAAQLTGIRTWFWLDPARWQAEVVRAEIPGLWAEVTAVPVRATWTPGDGNPPVTCDGPGRPHPGTSGATTDCGHVYTTVGAYTLGLAVTYEVTWRSSTGETGVRPPLVLTSSLPLTVEQRQVVVS